MDDLHELIHSLQPVEKRYIKRMAGETSTRHVALFDAINAQAAYDEAALRERFRANGWFKNFAEAKRYLTELILRGLRQYNDGRSPKFEVLNLLEEVEVLYAKGQYSLLAKRLGRARQLAAAAELPELEQLALQWHHQCKPLLPSEPLIHVPGDDRPERFRALLAQQRLLPQIMEVGRKVRSVMRTHGYPCTGRSELPGLAAGIAALRKQQHKHPGVFTESLSIDALEIMLQQMANNVERSYAISCRMAGQVEQMNGRTQAEKLYTITNIYQMQIGLAGELQQYNLALEHMAAFRAFLNKPAVRQAKVPLNKHLQFRLVYHAIIAHLDLGQAAETKAALAEGEHCLTQLNPAFIWSHFLTLRLILAALALGYFAKAKAYILRLQARHDLRTDVQNLLLILRLMVEYELANTDLAEHLFRQSSRQLRKNGHDPPIDHRMLEFLRELMNTANLDRPLLEMKRYLQNALHQTESSKSRPELLFFLAWTESKQRGGLAIDHIRTVAEEMR